MFRNSDNRAEHSIYRSLNLVQRAKETEDCPPVSSHADHINERRLPPPPPDLVFFEIGFYCIALDVLELFK